MEVVKLKLVLILALEIQMRGKKKETRPELQVLWQWYFISECVRNRGMDPVYTREI